MTLNLPPERIEAIIKKQNEIDRLADVWYQIYYDKSSWSKFWGSYLNWGEEPQ